MKRILLLASIGFLLTVFFSCQKELHFPDLSTNSDSIYLDKIYEFDNVTMDTVKVTTFAYDNQKRVTSMLISNYPTGFTNYTYNYNGTDTLPYRSISLQEIAGSYDTTTIYHTYDNMQRNLKDSIVLSFRDGGGTYAKFISTFNYSYEAGKRYGHDVEVCIAPAFSTYDRWDTAIVDANNNILSDKGYNEFTPGSMELDLTADITYDNHINPFSILSNFKAHQQFPVAGASEPGYFPYNNALSRNQFTYGTTTGKTYVYTYKPNEFPGTAIVTTTSGGGSYSEKIIYTYRKL